MKQKYKLKTSVLNNFIDNVKTLKIDKTLSHKFVNNKINKVNVKKEFEKEPEKMIKLITYTHTHKLDLIDENIDIIKKKIKRKKNDAKKIFFKNKLVSYEKKKK